MDYKQLVSRAKPGLIILILDDSGSMADIMPGTSVPRFKYVEQYCGIILKDLLDRCTEAKGDGTTIRSRYYIYVIRYGSTAEIWGEHEMDIQKTLELFTKSGNSLGLGGHLGGTDAESAFKEAYDYLKEALSDEKFKDSFPPMVFHLTDGMSHTDASQIAEQIKGLSTSDGNVLVVNAYIGTQTNLNYKGPEDFPGYLDVSEAGQSEDNIRLFNMSSQAPETIEENLKSEDIFPQLRSGSRLFFDVRTKEMLKNVIQVVSSMPSRMAR